MALCLQKDKSQRLGGMNAVLRALTTTPRDVVEENERPEAKGHSPVFWIVLVLAIVAIVAVTFLSR